MSPRDCFTQESSISLSERSSADVSLSVSLLAELDSDDDVDSLSLSLYRSLRRLRRRRRSPLSLSSDDELLDRQLLDRDFDFDAVFFDVSLSLPPPRKDATSPW